MAKALMAASTEQLIRTGRAHLGRFAFQKRDNPFVSSRAILDLRPALVTDLARLLDGEVDPEEWLESKVGSRLLKTVKIGLIPREARLVVVDGKLVAGVESVHGFLQAHLFWWLVSILWNISLAKSLDPLFGEEVKGSRFHRSFLRDPTSSGFMFRDRSGAYQSWKSFPAQTAEQHQGEILGANSLDIKAFYYSIDATPRSILNGFFSSKGEKAPRTRHARVLTRLLCALHAQYAARCGEVQPRRADLGEEGVAPLPVGLPSSEVLANMVMSLALDDIAANDAVLGLAAYADDVIVMTPSEALTGFDEDPSAYFARLGLTSDGAPDTLHCPSLDSMATLRLQLDKCEVSYSHHPEGDEEGEGIAALLEEGLSDNWDPYIEGDTGSEWGGRLRTILRSPHKRERIPRELKEEILELVGEIRVGLTPEEVKTRFAKLITDLDHGHLLSLQPFWPELLVGGIATHGIEIIEVLTTEMRGVIDSVKMPDGATPAARRALSFGLRASWQQALAQAIAVATSEEERAQLLEVMPELNLGQSQSFKMSTAVEHGMRMRKRRLIPSSLVAAPLAEFTSWEGRLIGGGAFSDFVEWFQREHPGGGGDQLVAAVAEAVRFIHLHEVCLSIHLWAAPGDGCEDEAQPDEEPGPWFELAFEVLGTQPLIQEDLVADLRERAEGHLAALGRRVGEGEQQLVRMAMPSIQVNETQLQKLLAGELSALGQIARDSRAAVQMVVETATASAVRFLVLPEWAVVVQQLPWLFEQSLRYQMLVIGGQAPEVVGDKYRNWLWTGIPLTDKGRHRVCLVPPPRQKLFLSPKEEALLTEHEIVKAPATEAISIYQWRGMRIASMICYEFADIGIRNFLRFQADVITVSSLNLDWHYFDAVQDATTRDNYCLTVCVNTGTYPGTRITRPTSSEKAVVASVHGSDDPAVITKRVDVTPIVAAQIHKCEPKQAGIEEPGDGLSLSDYKPFPPV